MFHEKRKQSYFLETRGGGGRGEGEGEGGGEGERGMRYVVELFRLRLKSIGQGCSTF